MSTIKQIKAPISNEIAQFNKEFISNIKTEKGILDKVLKYIIKRKGKQIRPVLVLLSAKLVGKISERTFTAATLIELLHTATLVHDDVVDNSNIRRGFFSVNALWKNKIAVLIGDFLLAKGLDISVKKKEFRILEIVSETVQQMSKGELLQIQKSRNLEISEKIYFEIIEKKTASLMAACCECGATSTTKNKKDIFMLRNYGELIGLIFQIKDDLFDYEKTSIVGKPVAFDIKDRKMTLPLIYTLNHCSEKEKKFIIRTIKKSNSIHKEVLEVIEIVKSHGGIKYAKNKMEELRLKAIEIINKFDDSETKNSLIELTNYMITRKK